MLTSDLDRIKAKLVPARGGCLVWTGARVGNYGTIQIRGKSCLVHRVMWQGLLGSTLSPGHLVFQTCGNPLCCQLSHLWSGTRVQWNKEKERLAIERHGRRYAREVMENFEPPAFKMPELPHKFPDKPLVQCPPTVRHPIHGRVLSMRKEALRMGWGEAKRRVRMLGVMGIKGEAVKGEWQEKERRGRKKGVGMGEGRGGKVMEVWYVRVPK